MMNEGKECVGGIYWGRYIYRDLYAFLTPEEIVGTMTACGIDGYTSYGMNGLDDGGVLNRMEDDFLESLRRGNTWCAEVIPRRGKKRCEFQRYETGRCISAYADDVGKCIVMQEIEKGKVISCGVQLGASYVAKNIPHVPYEQRNKEMYPIIQARSTLLEDLLGVCGQPVSGSGRIFGGI